MVSINYATREVSCKIVYYGPGLSGKTTNLQYVHHKVPNNTKGKLISLATDADRTLYFDFLPINIGTINGFAAKFQLYTVPGQVYYNATRKLVLRGVDGLVFVADSQPDKMDENIESLNNLKENLAEYGYNLDEIPIVIQYNKQDLPNVMRAGEMSQALNAPGWPEFEASATEGFGVFDTLKCILKLVLDKAKAGGTAPTPSQAGSKPEQPAATPVTEPQPTAGPPSPAAPSPSRQTVEPEPRESADPDQTRPSEPTSIPAAAREVTPEPVTDVREPVLQASGSKPQVEPERPAQQPSSQPEPQPESQPELRREPATPDANVECDGKPAYRPFPGNTREDEEQMRQLYQRVRNEQPEPTAEQKRIEEPVQASSNPDDAGNDDTEPKATEAARMAPSLKVDKPRKKRSFFKRLFGLK